MPGNLLNALMENDTSTNYTLPVPPLTDSMLVPFGILMVVENVISIGLLYICTRLSFQIRIMSLNLALSDFLTGIFLSIPNTMLYERYHCDIKKYPSFLFITVSLFIVTMMNVDRCFVFVLAMRYYSFINKKLIIKLSVALWVIGLFVTYGLFFDVNDEYGISCIMMSGVKRNIVTFTCKSILIIIVAFNLVMFVYLIVQIRRKVGRSSDNKDPTQSTMFAREQTRIARKISIIIGVFLMAFFPFMIIYTLPFDSDSAFFKTSYIIVSMMLLFNSACNPVFYVWRFTEPRYHL
ncbi:trace amine-associated receptor 2-like [Saccostrea echinata]|uniref:trace amine-associated receptor 2-like n=1 Tax=Saccostrea echinata TaxID=191078 RepID=UPI002A7FF703|nr:trace amine-associated receptor 2-like [Saccostrea echinata]